MIFGERPITRLSFENMFVYDGLSNLRIAVHCQDQTTGDQYCQLSTDLEPIEKEGATECLVELC